MGGKFKEWAKVFKALGDENRLKILLCIAQREDLCVCELQALLKLAQPTVSRHLKILEEAGFVEGRRQGQWVIYKLHCWDGFRKMLVRSLNEIFQQDEELKELWKRAREINLRVECLKQPMDREKR